MKYVYILEDIYNDHFGDYSSTTVGVFSSYELAREFMLKDNIFSIKDYDDKDFTKINDDCHRLEVDYERSYCIVKTILDETVDERDNRLK